MIVLDTSIAAALVLPDETEVPGAIRRRIFAGPVIVPQHWWLEIANALVSAERRKRLSRAAREGALEQLRTLQVRSDELTAQAAWTESLRLADQHRLTMYDAPYLELASRLSAALASTDADLVEAARARGIEVLTYAP